MESRSPSQGTEQTQVLGTASATGRGRQRGVQRVVMAVRDLDAGKAFYSKLLDCEFLAADPADTEAFGVAVAISFDGGIELVAPVPGADSYVESILDARGEGLIGVVWAVADADACRDAAAELGVGLTDRAVIGTGRPPMSSPPQPIDVIVGVRTAGGASARGVDHDSFWVSTVIPLEVEHDGYAGTFAAAEISRREITPAEYWATDPYDTIYGTYGRPLRWDRVR